ncbi:MAG: asnB 1, partial [Bacteroidetes bacterium]|nr:asnB 1 [Bacteroidota bacterium]
MLYEYVPAPESGYLHIKQLPMGSYAKITTEHIVVKKWWQPPFPPKEYHDLTENQALRLLDDKLRVAVQRRLVSDVPVGLLLSGGIDSTTIGWYVQDLIKTPLHSFSVSFPQKSFNESYFIHQAARHLGTRHHDVSFNLAQFPDVFSQAVTTMDIPFGDSSFL